jgi:hypothetical protein
MKSVNSRNSRDMRMLLDYERANPLRAGRRRENQDRHVRRLAGEKFLRWPQGQESFSMTANEIYVPGIWT